MDSLSLFLQNVLQQNDEHTQWIEQLSVDSLEDNLGNADSQIQQINTSPYLSSSSISDDIQNNEDQDQENDDVNTQKKRKRQDVKNQCEAKRRVKFNEQLDMLRALVVIPQPQEGKKKKSPKLTREALMSCAIEEILKLRQELSEVHQFLSESDTPFQKLRTGRYRQFVNPVEVSLSDPHNRSPYSTQDLERAFQTVFAREVEQIAILDGSRTEQTIYHSIKLLEDMSRQLGKPEYQLSVGVLDQLFHSAFRFSPKDLPKKLELNWNTYQAFKKTDTDNLLLVLDVEVGAWVLSAMSWVEYMTGNLEASERTFGFTKDLVKRIRHRGTSHGLLTSCLMWSLHGVASVETARKINDIVQADFPWGPLGKAILGTALIVNGQHREGLEFIELSVKQMIGRKGDSIHLVVATMIVEAYIQTRTVDRGICVLNYLMKKQAEFNIEGFLGKPELLRQKANLYILKKYPDFIPEPISTKIIDPAIEEVVTLCEPEIESNQLKPVYGPIEAAMILSQQSSTDITSDDIEMILRSAMNLAQSKGLYIIELRCAIDLVRFFLHIGQNLQATETVQMVKTCVARMKGPDDTRELQRARYVMSLVESSLVEDHRIVEIS